MAAGHTTQNYVDSARALARPGRTTSEQQAQPGHWPDPGAPYNEKQETTETATPLRQQR